MKEVLNKLNMNDNFDNRKPVSINSVWALLHEKTCKNWEENIFKMPKVRIYVKFKQRFEVEPYILSFMNRKTRSYLVQFRSGILPLQIEVGRWANKNVEERLYLVYNEGLVEDEQPFTFLCRNVVDTGISDFHRLIYGILPGACEHFKPKCIQYCSFRKFNKEDILNDIALSPLFNYANDLDINIGMSKYITITQEICEKHAPIKTKFINKVQLPIMNSKLRKEIIKKCMFQHRFNKKRDCANKELLHVQRNLVTTLTRKSISKYFKERCNKNSTQKQRFWKTMAPFMKNSSDTFYT